MAAQSDDLVTLQEVIDALHFSDAGDDDARLNGFITAASLSIMRFLKTEGDEWRDTSGDIVTGMVPADIRAATIWWVGYMDQNTDDDSAKLYQGNWLPDPVRSMLHSRREPTLA